MSQNVPQVWKAGHSGATLPCHSRHLQWAGEGSVWAPVCLRVSSLTCEPTAAVTVDQMDLDVDGLIKCSVIGPPTLTDISSEG